MFRKGLLAYGVSLFLTMTGIAQPADGVVVTAKGRAVGGQEVSREKALADALREAIRVGVGVDLVSQTKVEDFQLEYDRIMTSAFGYVRDYAVIQQGLGDDGVYTVTVKATVGKGTPGLDDELALRQLIARKGCPRVSVEVDEAYANLPADFGDPPQFASAWFEATAQSLKLNLVGIETVSGGRARAARRDEAFGEQQNVRIRNADFELKSDVVLQVKLRARYLGVDTLYGTLPQHRFSMNCELRAVRPDSGKVLVTIPMPGIEDLESDKKDVRSAAREIVVNMMKGDDRLQYPGAMGLFRRLLSHYIVELDFGTLITIELDRVRSRKYRELVGQLNEVKGVEAVYEQSFDRRGFSYLEVRSRLKSAELSRTIEDFLGLDYALDRATPHFIQFAYDPEEPAQGRQLPRR